MRLGPPEGREARLGKTHLQRPEVAAAQRRIVEQIHRALALTRVDLLDHICGLLRQREQIATKLKKLRNQFFELGVSTAARGHDQNSLPHRNEEPVTPPRWPDPLRAFVSRLRHAFCNTIV